MKRRIGYVLKEVQSKLRAQLNEAIGVHGITVSQYAVLAALESNPGISNAELARQSFVTPQTMMRILKNLKGLSLIDRKPHPEHGRILQTILTAEGKQLISACHEEVLKVENQMLNPLTLIEQEQLMELLKRCVDNR